MTAFDYEERSEMEAREKETKAERRLRRKKELQQLLHLESCFGETTQTQGTFVSSRRYTRKTLIEKKERELLQLAALARRPRYSDEEIGKMFRELFRDF